MDELRFGAGQQGRAFVDLIERVRADHHGGRLRRVDDRLCKRKQGFAAAINRQNLGGGVRYRDAVTPSDPAGNRLAQRIRAQRCRINRQTVQAVDQGFANESGRRVFRLADVQADDLASRRGRAAGQQRAEPLEGVTVQPLKTWIQRNVAKVLSRPVCRRHSLQL